jgi:hypothetical protein
VADLARDDLRAAVAAGVLSEAQASRLMALAEARAGYRGAMAADDEPFELFRGFNEVFVALGVALLGAGVWTLALLQGVGASGPQALAAGVAWLLAEYLTRRRRMVLPSLLLAIGFVAPAAGLAGTQAMAWLLRETEPGRLGELMASGGFGATIGLAACLGGALAALAFYLRFRLPFAVFLVGLAGFAAALIAGGLLDPVRIMSSGGVRLSKLFDLRAQGGLGLVTLGFGLACFAVAMAFDLRDPHRVSRLSACGFWLHLIAAPAIVNTLALTLWSLPGLLGAIGLGLAVAFMAAVALVIDRRSFLMATVVWLAVLLGSAFGAGTMATALLLLALGGFLTATGAGWARLRGLLMEALPNFPAKDRLPPWSATGSAIA